MDKMKPKGPEVPRPQEINPEVKEGQYGLKETLELITFVEKATLILLEGMRDGLSVTDILQAIGRTHRELIDAIGGSDRIMLEVRDLGPTERVYLTGRLLEMVGAVLSGIFPQEEPRIMQTIAHLQGLLLLWMSGPLSAPSEGSPSLS